MWCPRQIGDYYWHQQQTWDGNSEFEFEISGDADASYKPYLDTALSVGGHGVFLNGAPISEKSKIQQSTTLSVTEAELCSGGLCSRHVVCDAGVGVHRTEDLEAHENSNRQQRGGGLCQ
jgi:hypothetical protein